MISKLKRFFHKEDGVVTVDWTTLSALMVGITIAAVAILNSGFNVVVSRADHELRTQQFSDDFVQFTPDHFEQLYQHGLSESDAQVQYDLADQMMNQELIDALAEGIPKMEAGELSVAELAELHAIASVAYQRNVVPDEILEYHFGFGDGGS